MGNKDLRFRIDPSRAIYILGEFNDGLLQQVVPRIVELRADDDKPISVVIDSIGGEVVCLDSIVTALGVRGWDGGTSRVITSVVGQANSCGAILLALGDYAVAANSSTIHFHGTRRAGYDITVERARRIAQDLANKNQRISDHLSEMMLPRVIHRYLRLRADILKALPKMKQMNMRRVNAYVALASTRVSPAAKRIFQQAFERFQRIQETAFAIRKIRLKSRRKAKNDAQVLNKLIDRAVRNHSKEHGWEIDGNALGSIASDYLILRDFSFGNHNDSVGFYIRAYGPDFLSKSQFSAFNKVLKSSEKKAFQFLMRHVYKDVADFWYLTVCISRFVLAGENPFTANDAYWLGIIDEILGDPDAHGMRQIVEARKVPSASNAQPQPSSQSPNAAP